MSALGAVVNHLHAAREAGQTDESLLQAFAGLHDDDAFAALVRRHGPLVRGVCRRLLRDDDEADDTFQATFLVLAKKAGSIRRQQSVGSWLYGVAYRLALKARTRLARRPITAEPDNWTAPDEAKGIAWRELRVLLDEELSRLPEELRAPLLLCYLEGRTQDEATRHLGWSLGTFRRRLERGRDLLRARLTRRGCSLSAALLPLVLAPGEAAAVPPALLTVTVRAAAAFAAGVPSAALSPSAVTSARGLLNAMVITKLKVAAVVLLALGAVSGATVFVTPLAGETPAAAAATPAPEPVPDPALRKAWSDLASTDTAVAMRALFTLAKAPKESVPLVNDRLKVVLAEVTPQRITELIEALDSPKFAERERAGRELEAVLEEAAPHLQKVLNGKPSLELKRRVEVLLSRRVAEDTLGARSLQVRRALGLLEHVGNADARAVLTLITRDGKEGWVVKEAESALKRLAAKQPAETDPWAEMLGSDTGIAARAFLALTTQAGEERAAADQVRPALKLADDVPPLLLRSRGVTSRQLPHELLPYSKKVLALYADDRKDSPFRETVREGIRALKKSENDLPIQEEFIALAEPELAHSKLQIEAIQKQKIGDAIFQIAKVADELDDLKDTKKNESKLWQAYYDYVLAHLYAREACILEYSSMLGKIRRDDLPQLDTQKHKGWRLTAREMMTDKDAREFRDRARKQLRRLVDEHKATPWELIARQETVAAFGLEWMPLAK